MTTASEHRWDEDLRLAHLLASRADDLTLERFLAADLQVETKPDMTPVTDADKACEDMIRQHLAHTRSRDSVVGEESGASGYSSRKWIIDPIDGTKNFVRGVPVWATLIGLIEDGEPVVGVVSAPALGQRWWAAKGLGAHSGKSMHKQRSLHVSQVSDLEHASLSYSSLEGWANHRRLRGFMRLAQACWRNRAYGDFWSHMLVAEGAVDLSAEPELNLWDMTALVPIVTEAGGKFTSLQGEDGPFGGSAVVTNGLLHEAVLDYIGAESD